MTLAIDKDGKVLGQVCAALPPGTLKTGLDANVSAIVLLTKEGYVNVDAASVRLEEVR